MNSCYDSNILWSWASPWICVRLICHIHASFYFYLTTSMIWSRFIAQFVSLFFLGLFFYFAKKKHLFEDISIYVKITFSPLFFSSMNIIIFSYEFWTFELIELYRYRSWAIKTQCGIESNDSTHSFYFRNTINTTKSCQSYSYTHGKNVLTSDINAFFSKISTNFVISQHEKR